ncbi:MAG: LysR family transcriptional regulator, partial [Rhodospirillaceae bacterium]
MDRFEEIQTFVRVAETLSVTRAAAQLNVAPSAVSRRLRDLEDRLGTRLLHRTTRRIALTDSGRAFYARSLRVLSDLEEAETEAADDGASLSGTLRLAVPMSLALSALNAAIADFLELHPAVVAHIDISDRMIDLVAEGIDLAIRVGQLPDSALIARRISTVR